MIIYNVTIKLEFAIHREWLDYMKEVHVPDVMNTGMFQSHRICRLIDPADKDGFTYAIQYFAKDIGKIKEYQDRFAPDLQKDHNDRFKDQFVAFRTLLKIVD